MRCERRSRYIKEGKDITCILAYQCEDYAMMASDRLIADSWVVHNSAEPKTKKIDGWLVGSSGPTRVNNAIRHLVDHLPIGAKKWDEETIVRDVVYSIRESLCKTDYVVIDGYLGGKEDIIQGKLLFARPGCIFVLHADWAVDVWQNPVAAIGTGERYASASLLTSISTLDVYRKNMGYSIPIDHTSMRMCMQLAMRVTSELDNFTGGNCDVILSERKENDQA